MSATRPSSRSGAPGGGCPFRGKASNPGAGRIAADARKVRKTFDLAALDQHGLDLSTPAPRPRQPPLEVSEAQRIALRHEQNVLAAILIARVAKVACDDLDEPPRRESDMFENRRLEPTGDSLEQLRNHFWSKVQAAVGNVAYDGDWGRQRQHPELAPIADRLQAILTFNRAHQVGATPAHLSSFLSEGVGTAMTAFEDLARIIPPLHDRHGVPTTPEAMGETFRASRKFLRSFAIGHRTPALHALFELCDHNARARRWNADLLILVPHGKCFRVELSDEGEAQLEAYVRSRVPEIPLDGTGCPALVHLDGSNAIDELAERFARRLPETYRKQLA